jgi:hypothetical protein
MITTKISKCRFCSSTKFKPSKEYYVCKKCGAKLKQDKEHNVWFKHLSILFVLLFIGMIGAITITEISTPTGITSNYIQKEFYHK